MSHPFSPVANYSSAYTLPDDGDSDASSVNVPLEALADGLKFAVEKGVDFASSYEDVYSQILLNFASTTQTNIFATGTLLTTAKAGDKILVTARCCYKGDTAGELLCNLRIGNGSTWQDIPGSFSKIASDTSSRILQLNLQAVYTISTFGVGDLRIALAGLVSSGSTQFSFYNPSNVTVQLLRRSS